MGVTDASWLPADDIVMFIDYFENLLVALGWHSQRILKASHIAQGMHHVRVCSYKVVRSRAKIHSNCTAELSLKLEGGEARAKGQQATVI